MAYEYFVLHPKGVVIVVSCRFASYCSARLPLPPILHGVEEAGGTGGRLIREGDKQPAGNLDAFLSRLASEPAL